MQAWTFKKVFTTAAGIALFAFLTVGCNQKQKEAAVVRSYQYFPKANVYFDPKEVNYTFFDAEAKSWQTQKKISDSLKNLLDKNVVVTRAQPWTDNGRERMVAAVALYAVPADFVEKPAPQPTKNGVINQTPATEDQPHESGVKRFLKKLFGKKNKKDTLEIQ